MTLTSFSRSIFYTFVVLILSVAVQAQSSNTAPKSKPASAETTTDFVISGETGLKWVNTGITVAAGDTVRLEAKGEIDVGGTWGTHGPEGTTNFSEQPPGYYPVESRVRYGLAARITLGSGRRFQSTQTWVYGDKKEMRVMRSGILWLTVNDDAPEGNVGEFNVRITIVKKKR
jgi:hypothetical protein